MSDEDDHRPSGASSANFVKTKSALTDNLPRKQKDKADSRVGSDAIGSRPTTTPSNKPIVRTPEGYRGKPGRPSGGGRFGPRRPTAAKPRGADGPNRFIYGQHAVSAAWANPQRTIVRMLATETALAAFGPPASPADVARPGPALTDRVALDKLLGDVVHQGIAAEVEPLPVVDLSDLIVTGTQTASTLAIALDQVTDPHNVGAILRTAAVFGAAGLILPRRKAPEASGVIAKTASGGLELVPMIRVTSFAKALRELAEAGWQVIGLDEAGPAALPALPRAERAVVVMGAEGAGLRPGVRDACTVLARLPTQGAMTTLNVSNAAAITLYELMRHV